MSDLPFASIPIQESGEGLIDLSTYDLVLSPEYFKQGLSKDKRMFLRKTVADKLGRVQESLDGYKLKIWDGFRSREVQENIYQRYWNELHAKHPEWDDERLKKEVDPFVSTAREKDRIPPHASGGAVDLTLVDAKGDELNMGTAFDHFGPEAAAFYYDEHDIDEEIRNNRALLREAMLRENFVADLGEWWHFDYGSQKWAYQKGDDSHAIYSEAPVPTQ